MRGVSGSCSAGQQRLWARQLVTASRVETCVASRRLASPRLTWTEVMGDSKEAGTEAPPAGAAARGGLSLLSQGESEEPSAQVSPRWGGTCRAPWAAGPLGREGCHGSRRLLAPSPRLPDGPPNGVEVRVPVGVLRHLLADHSYQKQSWLPSRR